MDILSLFPTHRTSQGRSLGREVLEKTLRGGDQPMSFPFIFRRPRVSHEAVRTVQIVAEQVVMSVEQTFRMAGERKKQLALKLLADLLAEIDIKVPDLLLDTAIEAAVRAMKILEQAADIPAA